ncbi:MAG TPA: hypothetical protein VLH77_02125 [Gammaproteobacteria bacterium]|nr:hypothetical protein [Gammaproteobacteria bacterium]
MMRYFLFLIIFLTVPCFSAVTPCPQAEPISSPNFCASFRTSAICHCVLSGLPEGMCQDIPELYERMIALFGSVETACAYQQDASQQTCLDDWQCYRVGGSNAEGQLCSASGNKCE